MSNAMAASFLRLRWSSTKKWSRNQSLTCNDLRGSSVEIRLPWSPQKPSMKSATAPTFLTEKKWLFGKSGWPFIWRGLNWKNSRVAFWQVWSKKIRCMSISLAEHGFHMGPCGWNPIYPSSKNWKKSLLNSLKCKNGSTWWSFIRSLS